MAEFGNNIDLSLFDPSQINWDALGATNPIPPPPAAPAPGGGGGGGGGGGWLMTRSAPV